MSGDVGSAACSAPADITMAAAAKLHRVARANTAGRSNKLHRNAAKLAEVAMQRIALSGMHHAGERAGKDDVTRLERHAVLAELVGEPGDAERGMPEHAGGDAGLFDFRIAIHNAADPAQIDFERPNRTATDD